MAAGVVGFALVVAGLVTGLIEAHLSRLKAWDRPRWALGPVRGVLPVVRWIALALGVAVLAGASPVAAAGVATVLAAGWARLRWVRSERYVARQLRTAVADLRRRDPDAREHELLGRAVLERHPEWGPELVEQMVRDHPRTPSLARMIARMERGWPGTA